MRYDRARYERSRSGRLDGVTTDTTERGLEDLICRELVGESVADAENDGSSLNDRAAVFGAGWMMGDSLRLQRGVLRGSGAVDSVLGGDTAGGGGDAGFG